MGKKLGHIWQDWVSAFLFHPRLPSKNSSSPSAKYCVPQENSSLPSLLFWKHHLNTSLELSFPDPDPHHMLGNHIQLWIQQRQSLPVRILESIKLFEGERHAAYSLCPHRPFPPQPCIFQGLPGHHSEVAILLGEALLWAGDKVTTQSLVPIREFWEGALHIEDRSWVSRVLPISLKWGE